MGIENAQGNAVLDDPYRMGGEVLAPQPKGNRGKRKRAEISDDAKQKLHGRLMNWFLQERDKQAMNRYEAAIDEDFYDGLQWSDEDVQELNDRGQAPLVFNQVKPTINWLLGTERRTRIDGKVLPREESDEDGAEVKTKLLKYLSDTNRTPFARSQQWKSSIVAGVGWMEDAINKDPSQELLATRYVDWKQIYYDSNSKELDISDARYVFRWSFLDLDVAQALCPNFTNVLQAAAVEDNQVGMDEDDVWYLGARVNSESTGDFAAVSRRGMRGGIVSTGRERVKVIEAWYRVPVSCTVCRAYEPEANQFHGEEWDAQNPDMVAAREQGYLSIAQHVRMEVRVAVMTEGTLLYESKSPYKHNKFPFTPMWCYRRHRDQMPYGVIRDIRDAQIDYNKRASKALFILSTVRVTMDEGAYEDIETVRAEAARPDAIFTPRKGYRFEIDTDKALADQHIKLMMFDGQMIRDVGGVTDQNLGKDDKGLSGQAIGKLQDQGSIVTAALFDNMRLAFQLQTEIQLSLLEQFYSAAKVVRIVGENKPVEWLKLNQWDAGAAQFINDITKSKADYIVSEQDFKASIRQAMFESMMDLIGKLPPEVGLSLLDMVLDFADVPNKEELISRVRKVNGQTDPSRKPTEEELQAQQVQQAKVDAAEKMQMATAAAELEKLRAEARAANAKADTATADQVLTEIKAMRESVTAFYEALQGAQIVSTVPNVAPVADAIMAGAGYVDKGGTDPNIPGPTGAMPAMTPRSDHGDYVGAAPGAEAPPGAGAAPAADPRQLSLPELQQADGAAGGIQTLANDGVQ